ncbi:hypothetical protein [Streptomyces sp. NPDC126499]|uniref:hypothetical protein n=1 Tax=Streptomyces sp. NPDC126499 TaxID=3155314 RepID=UPI003327BA61
MGSAAGSPCPSTVTATSAPSARPASAGELGPPDAALAASRRTLGAHGDLSSASVPKILKGAQTDRPPPGTIGLMLAFGPGFSSELVLLAR